MDKLDKGVKGFGPDSNRAQQLANRDIQEAFEFGDFTPRSIASFAETAMHQVVAFYGLKVIGPSGEEQYEMYAEAISGRLLERFRDHEAQRLTDLERKKVPERPDSEPAVIIGPDKVQLTHTPHQLLYTQGELDKIEGRHLLCALEVKTADGRWLYIDDTGKAKILESPYPVATRVALTVGQDGGKLAVMPLYSVPAVVDAMRRYIKPEVWIDDFSGRDSDDRFELPGTIRSHIQSKIFNKLLPSKRKALGIAEARQIEFGEIVLKDPSTSLYEITIKGNRTVSVTVTADPESGRLI